ncbi:uncharacterized protein TNCV_2823071 [Trichonephila clavipes]|nr:uncharacterized protein TNCV_2823071 [Trichonephila clavipes]
MPRNMFQMMFQGHSKKKSIAGDLKHNILMIILGWNPGEDMDVCKCIVPSQHGGTFNNRRAANPLIRSVTVDDRWEAPDPPQGVLPQNRSGTELN